MTFQRSSAIDLRVLIALIKSSPIFVRRAARLLLARKWASVRNSPDVDAYVLAWIASHVRDRTQSPRRFT